MKDKNFFLVFFLDERRFAIPIMHVERVVRAIEITVLPKAPEIVMGVVNFKGKIVPVIDIRQRFNLPKAELNVSHQMIIINLCNSSFVLLVDSVEGNIEKPDMDIVHPTDIIEGIHYLEGVIRMDDGVLMVPNLEKILTVQENSELENALQTQDGFNQ